MTLKKLLFLGSVLGGIALMRDKTRRDRVVGGAKDMLRNARDRLDTLRAGESTTSTTTTNPSFVPPSGAY